MDPLDNDLLFDVDAPRCPADSYMDSDGRALWCVADGALNKKC